MRIDQIVLHNFGSYEGENTFDTKPNDQQNIVLIGGKNGAGKTTLFTAMRLCLYGYMSMGYKNANAYYFRAITKLVNNTAKLTRPATAYVQMALAIGNGQTLDHYVIKRVWLLNDTIEERFWVERNGDALTEQEVADFEKYILTLIPPELFNLYFFDGEKIADFFLDEGGNTRLKNAFLTLCGYDTFDIMRKNFKRIGGGKKATPMLEEYIAAKELVENAERELAGIDSQLLFCIQKADECEVELSTLEKEYRQKGGVSQEEWNEKLLILREEEKKREQWNALLKKWANDVVPFLMIRGQLEALKVQIESEENSLKYRHFCEVLHTEAVKSIAGSKIDELVEAAREYHGDAKDTILELSLTQKTHLLVQLERILEFDSTKIPKCKRAIQKSLNITAKTRAELDNSNITFVQEYMKRRADLLEEKSELLLQRLELEQQATSQREQLQIAQTNFAKIQSKLEDDLKQASIHDISTRAILMLDKLQTVLYHRQIQKVENYFRKEIRVLMRKTKFIDDIRIDDDFGTHIYRTEPVSFEKIETALLTGGTQTVISLFGVAAFEKLKSLLKTGYVDDMVHYCSMHRNETIDLPFEIDKTSLSNGEKQVYIMALYHSLVQLCKHELPFIIDTPFARIDTEHRRNISKHFFSKLKGQVFILSTNEEINAAHMTILQNHITATYILENTDNVRTTVKKNMYFEV